ncbi:SpvB/TcaC N-terminal domain-containing protein [Achromobacter aloeverae]
MGKTPTAPAVTPAPPTLPQPGAGGLGLASVEAAPIGNQGGTGFSIDLPISPGRGHAPRLALASGAGDGAFGWGWDAGIPSIRRRLDHGFPRYERDDDFVGPDGEVMTFVAEPCPLSWTPDHYATRQYMPRKQSDFSRIVYMQSPAGQDGDFWQVSTADGEIQWFGRTAAARVRDPADATRTAVWLLQESVTPDGQHIYYEYSPGPDAGQASRYLAAIHYGNVAYEQRPFLYLADTDAAQGPDGQQWLFTLLFDYGVPTLPWQAPAPYDTLRARPWAGRRQDRHVDHGYGFAVAADYLCRQVLMYHRLDGKRQLSGSGTPALVSRLWLDYEETPSASRLMGAQRMAYEADGTWRFLPMVDIEWTPDFVAPADAGCWTALAQAMALPIGGDAPEPDPILYSAADLYGEGMAGLLHRTGNCWYYRRPVRDRRPGAAARAITYGPRTLLDGVPVISGAPDNLLMDINGDGCLESLKFGAVGPRGYHAMQADRTWSAFVPVQSLPAEIGAPYARFGDMHGSGLPDLFVLSPTSVRYYANQSSDTGVAFAAPRDVAQDAGVVLPIPGRNPREWVNFADVLGSGQAHLVRLRHDSLTYWPWLGDGRFGSPVTMTASLPFDAAAFDPERVYFLPLFGPRAPDLVYADVDGIRIFQNQCGNGYAGTPVTIPYPAGFHLGALAQIRCSDLAGTGGVSIVLVQPYGDVTPPHGYPGSGATRYWRVDLNATAPYRLAALDNNAGARTQVSWRSSIQDWLDEKIETGDRAPGNRPGARMVVDQIAKIDYIANLQRISTPRYRDGVWDGREREPRGFRYTEIAQQTCDWPGATPVSALAPSVTRTWFHAGRDTDDQLTSAPGTPYFYGTPYSEPSAFADMATRYTLWTPATTDQAPWHDVALKPGQGPRWWQARALAGCPLRVETYGAGEVPLSARHLRWQSRMAWPSDRYPVVLPMQLESMTYDYEGYATDPLITQTVEMDADHYGYATWRLDIAYPRQLEASAANPYTDERLDPARRIPFPVAGNGASAIAGLSWTSTFDAQQTVLRITESRFQARHMDGADYRLGILEAERRNVLTYDDCKDAQPGGAGLHVESLSALADPACLLAPGQTRRLLAQSSHEYVDGLPGPLVLPAFTDKALLTAADYGTLLVNGLDADDIARAGYEAGGLLLTVPGGAPETDKVYIGRFDINVYYLGDAFWTLACRQTSSLAARSDGQPVYPVTMFSWDTHCVLVTKATDPYGNVVAAQTVDYRFLASTTLLDPNMNKRQAQLDALGRVIATSFSGTQLKAGGGGAVVEQVGFDDLDATPYDGNFDGAAPQNQASRIDYQANNMMAAFVAVTLEKYAGGTTTNDRLTGARYAFLDGPATEGTTRGFMRSRGRAWLAGNPAPRTPWDDHCLQYLQIEQATAQPPLVTTQTADAFSTSAAPVPAAAQQLLSTTTYLDGYNRELATFVRVPGGVQAYVVDCNGALATPAPAADPTTANAPVHAVRDYARHAPDGQTLARWPAFFLQYDAELATLYYPTFPRATTFPKYGQLPDAVPPDRYLYDALAREIRVVTGRVSDRTGQAYERRTYRAPWFTLEQDENDIDDELPDQPAPPASAARSLLSRIGKRSSRRRRR